AAADIAWSIRRAARLRAVDVVIVGRGGGWAEDLGAFNEEAVVRAIAASPVPVISAVGHEIDVTLADLAADARAATPTAAGEMAAPERALLVDELRAREKRLGRAVRHAAAALRARLAAVDKRLQSRDPRARLAADRRRLAALEARFHRRGRALLADRQHAWADVAARLDALSPLKVLDRGYAIVRAEDGAVVASVARVAPGRPLRVRLADGELGVTVTDVRPDGKD